MSPPGHHSARTKPLSWSPVTESNRRPSPYHGDALPTELTGPVLTCLTSDVASRAASLRALRCRPGQRRRAYRTLAVVAHAYGGVQRSLLAIRANTDDDARLARRRTPGNGRA